MPDEPGVPDDHDEEEVDHSLIVKRAEALERIYVADHDTPSRFDVEDYVVKVLLDEIREGKYPGDDKKRATDAFAKADANLTKRANKEMRKPVHQGVAFGEYDHIVVLAGINPDGTYSKVHTSRCCLGDMGQDEYNRWDAIQFERAEAMRRAYAEGREHFQPYLPHFARGLTVRQIEEQGLLGDEAA